MRITNYSHCKQMVTERLECCTQYSKQKKLKHRQGLDLGARSGKTAMKTCMDCTVVPAPIIPLELYMIFKT